MTILCSPRNLCTMFVTAYITMHHYIHSMLRPSSTDLNMRNSSRGRTHLAINMAPPEASRRHHCSFKMPQNPQYGCPRAGIMYQVSGDVYYCSFHDRYAQDRCQAFFDFQGSGMQCLKLYTMVDQDTGRKYCDKHEPSSESPEVDTWTARMIEWLTGVALAEPPFEDGTDFFESVSSKVEAVARDVEPEQEVKLVIHPELRSEIETKPDIGPGTGLGITPKIVIEYFGAGPPESDSLTGEAGTERSQDVTSTSETKQTMEQPLEPEPKPKSTPQEEQEQSLAPEPQPDHIAALYMQCNICLERHNATDMRQITSCGHQYKDSCLQDFLRRKGVRRYNCAGCRSWLQAHQHP